MRSATPCVRGIAPGHGQGLGAEIDRGHLGLLVFRRHGDGQVAGTGADVEHARLGNSSWPAAGIHRPGSRCPAGESARPRLTSNSSEKNSLRPTRYATGQPSSALPDQLAELLPALGPGPPPRSARIEIDALAAEGVGQQHLACPARRFELLPASGTAWSTRATGQSSRAVPCSAIVPPGVYHGMTESGIGDQRDRGLPDPRSLRRTGSPLYRLPKPVDPCTARSRTCNR